MTLQENGWTTTATYSANRSTQTRHKAARDSMAGAVRPANTLVNSSYPQSTADGKLVTDAKPTVIYIVDGKEVPSEEIKRMPSGEIESITVIKDSTRLAQYGERAKEGIIRITRKK